MSALPYEVFVGTPAGPWQERCFPAWPDALAYARELAARYPRWVVRAFNIDTCDEGFSGLTEDEEDDMDEAIRLARIAQ